MSVKETVLITGGQRGLGLELARQFRDDGFHVIAAGRHASMGEAGLEPLLLDLASDQSIAGVSASLAGRPIDILVHNAALRGAVDGLDAVERADFLATMTVNAYAPLVLTRALMPNIERGTRKLVAMISSRAGSNAEGHVGNEDGDYAYRMSKAALNMATTKLAHDLRLRQVAVIAFHPGWVRTDMGGADAPLGMDESARGLKALMLASTLADTARFRTHDGQDIGW